MNATHDHSIREFGRTRIAMRGDLVFSPRVADNETYYIVEDPIKSRFFRLGLIEYSFISLLDGRTTVSEALSLLSSSVPDHCLTQHDAATICRWLVESDLAHTAESASPGRLADAAAAADRKKKLGLLNPLAIKLSLGSPDRLLDAINPYISWLFSPAFTLVWFVVTTIGLLRIFLNWEQFVASSTGIFAPGNWLWIVGCWAALKIVHEIAHGAVCKRYGGAVRECGVIFVLLAPLAYVDVTASWRFRSKWQRIHTALAGMYIELLVAAIAAIVWSNTSTELVQHLCYNVIIMAGLTTLLFNANPLMRFDGYYVFSDLLGIPNLYTCGQQYLQYWSRKYVLALPTSLPLWPAGRGAIIRLYGVAALAWRILISATLIIAATTLFHGAGVVLAVAATALLLGGPTIRLARYFFTGGPGERASKTRCILTVGPALVAFAFVFVVVPWPGASQAPAVVEFSPPTIVRAGSVGFVQEILVENGEQVADGQVLMTLRNDQLERELADLELAVKQSEIKCRILTKQDKLADYQGELEQREALNKRMAEKRSQVKQLTVRAPSGGRIARRNLESLIGTYIDIGDEIVSIGRKSKKELRASISQNHLDSFTQCVGETVRIRAANSIVLRADLIEVNPRANLDVTYPALAASNGGPLAVAGQRTESGTDANETPQLLSPRFTGIVQLDQSQSRQLRAGQICMISHRAYDETIGAHLITLVDRWVQETVERCTQKDHR